MFVSFIIIYSKKNKGTKHEKRRSLTASETDALDAFDFLNETTRILELQSSKDDRTGPEIKEELKRSSDSGINLKGRRDSLSESLNSGNTEGSVQCMHSTQTLLLEDYSSDEEGLSFMLQEMVEISKAELNKGTYYNDIRVAQITSIFQNTSFGCCC